jgi:hypothetical protein
MGTFNNTKQYRPPIAGQREILQKKGWVFSKRGRDHVAIKVQGTVKVVLKAQGCCFKRIAAMVMAWEVKHGPK